MKFSRKFYRKYGSPGLINLSETSRRLSVCQLFVAEYERLQQDDSLTEEKLIEEAALALEARGIYLDPSRAPPKVSRNSDHSSWQYHNLWNYKLVILV